MDKLMTVLSVVFGVCACRTPSGDASSSVQATQVEALEDVVQWQTAIVKFTPSTCKGGGNVFVSGCTTTRISNDMLLTAAHCVLDGTDLKPVYIIPKTVDAGALIPPGSTNCVDPVAFAQKLVDVGAWQPDRIYVEPVDDDNQDLAIIQARNLESNVIPFAEARPAVGTTIVKFGFGATDCRRLAKDDSFRYDRDKASVYGPSSVMATLQSRESMKAISKKLAKAKDRPFETHLLMVSGADGNFSCPGDSGAGALVQAGDSWELVGVHTGGIGINDTPTGQRDLLKLETSMSVHSVEFCRFLSATGLLELGQSLFPKHPNHCIELLQ